MKIAYKLKRKTGTRLGFKAGTGPTYVIPGCEEVLRTLLNVPKGQPIPDRGVYNGWEVFTQKVPDGGLYLEDKTLVDIPKRKAEEPKKLDPETVTLDEVKFAFDLEKLTSYKKSELILIANDLGIELPDGKDWSGMTNKQIRDEIREFKKQ